MDAAIEPGPIHGIPAGKPTQEMSADELQYLWEQVNRNRDYPSVITLLQGEREADGEGEVCLMEIYEEMKSRGLNPLHTA